MSLTCTTGELVTVVIAVKAADALQNSATAPKEWSGKADNRANAKSRPCFSILFFTISMVSNPLFDIDPVLGVAKTRIWPVGDALILR